jgi:hypothetical protein
MPGWQNSRLTKCQADNMPGWQNARLTKCQANNMPGRWNAKLITCQVDNMPSWQYTKLTKFQAHNMISWQNAKLTICHIDKMPSWQHAWLTKCQADNMSGWQNANDQMVCRWNDKLAKVLEPILVNFVHFWKWTIWFFYRRTFIFVNLGSYSAVLSKDAKCYKTWLKVICTFRDPILGQVFTA